MADRYYLQETRFFIWTIKKFDELQLPYILIFFAETLHTYST